MTLFEAYMAKPMIVAFDETFADNEYEFEKADLAVMNHAPCRQYLGILDRVEKSHIHWKIVNTRKNDPPYPPVLWCEAKTLDDVLSLKPQFDSQIVLVIVHLDTDVQTYIDIVYHAEQRGYIVLNTGPWPDLKNGEWLKWDSNPWTYFKRDWRIVWDSRIFETMLSTHYNHLDWLIRQIEIRKASMETLKDSLDSEADIALLYAEEYGSSLVYAEEESIIESKQKQLAMLERLLFAYESSMKIVTDMIYGPPTAWLVVQTLHARLVEVHTRRHKIESEVGVLLNQLNSEPSWCYDPPRVDSEVSLHHVEFGHAQEQLWSYTGVYGILSGKILKKRAWSLLGISALGCSLLVTCTLFRHGGAGQDSYERTN